MNRFLRFLFISLFPVLLQNSAIGQARVQLIHNSADTANRFFDVWIGNNKVFNNLEFRTATAFVDVPTTGQISIVLTDSASTGPENPKVVYRRTYTDNHKYILVIGGMESSAGYNPYYDLGIVSYDLAREAATNASKTDLLFLQSSTDAPEVDVTEANIGLICNNLNYNDFDGYFGFTVNDDILFVKDNATQSTLYSYELPLLSLGLQGQAGVVLMSGFVDPSANNQGEAFGMFLALPEGGSFIPLPVYTEPMAPFQFVHNSPNPEADSLDIWIDGRLAINNMKFRTATAFNLLPAGRSIEIDVCLPNSISPTDPIVSTTLVMTEDQPYQVVLSGMTTTTGYNPPTSAALHVFTPAEVGSQVPGNTDLLFYNGSTDFGPLKVDEITTSLGTLTENLTFGSFDGYKQVLTADYAFEVRNSSDELVATYDASLATFAMNNQSTTVLASGFLDKTNNNNGPGFSLCLVPQNGGSLINLPVYSLPTYADIQLIHNSADIAYDTLDVWVNGEKMFADLAFRNATAFTQITAGSEITVAVKPQGSVSADNPLASQQFTPEAGKKYTLIINGIQSETGYNPPRPFSLTMIENTHENAVSGSVVDVMIVHQSTDAPSPADFVELNSVWLIGVEYGQHSNYMQKTVADYSIGFSHPDSTSPYNYYFLPVDELGFAGKAVMLLTSGFFDPTVNSNGAPFGLWAVAPGGGKMVELSNVTGIDNNDDPTGFAVYPNPTAGKVVLSFQDRFSKIVPLTLINLSGEKILNMQIPVNGGIARFDTSVLPVGFYIVRIDLDGKPCYRKLQVAR